MSGASGFIGTRLSTALRGAGWQVLALGRQALADPPDALAKRLRGVAVVINLAGAPILKRWTAAYRQTLVESRVEVTRRLVAAMAMMAKRPELFISTSAIGYYAPGRRHTEDNYLPADDFLGQLTRAWEQEAWGAKALGVRTVIFRLGVVLDPAGGALRQMLPLFRLGLGGVIGSGDQAFSWIHRHDLIRAYLAALAEPGWEGVYNLTAPEPTTNAGLTHALGAALHRPTRLAVPEFLLRLCFGDAACLLTKGQEVLPKRLLEAGFHFTYTTIEQAVGQGLTDRSSP